MPMSLTLGAAVCRPSNNHNNNNYNNNYNYFNSNNNNYNNNYQLVNSRAPATSAAAPAVSLQVRCGLASARKPHASSATAVLAGRIFLGVSVFFSARTARGRSKSRFPLGALALPAATKATTTTTATTATTATTTTRTTRTARTATTRATTTATTTTRTRTRITARALAAAEAADGPARRQGLKSLSQDDVESFTEKGDMAGLHAALQAAHAASSRCDASQEPPAADEARGAGLRRTTVHKLSTTWRSFSTWQDGALTSLIG
ncbi:unnamed protein product [Polarella glacialis]|uniref:Uncharacterized protein n=1 Tax=Polarella glacialis TaxID=89957 RepID=A0A813FD45_POLGL|nr:unnamed protein product [Polarella glacialis]